jgi:hypothetical protein
VADDLFLLDAAILDVRDIVIRWCAAQPKRVPHYVSFQPPYHWGGLPHQPCKLTLGGLAGHESARVLLQPIRRTPPYRTQIELEPLDDAGLQICIALRTYLEAAFRLEPASSSRPAETVTSRKHRAPLEDRTSWDWKVEKVREWQGWIGQGHAEDDAAAKVKDGNQNSIPRTTLRGWRDRLKKHPMDDP